MSIPEGYKANCHTFKPACVVEEVGPTNEGRQHLLLLHKQVHNKRGVAISIAQGLECILQEKCQNPWEYTHHTTKAYYTRTF